MERIQGSKNIALVECINPVRDKWKVRWDVQEPEEGNASYMEEDFDHKPTIEEIKTLIIAWYNAQVEEKIISGFMWEDIPVWLSVINQANIKAEYDLAFQTAGASLPVSFKFGDDEEPVLYTFSEMEEFTKFYQAMRKHIRDTQAAGWDTKYMTIDWREYEIGI